MASSKFAGKRSSGDGNVGSDCGGGSDREHARQYESVLIVGSGVFGRRFHHFFVIAFNRFPRFFFGMPSYPQ